MNIPAFLKQPSTILGIGTAAGTICGLIAHALTHDTSVAVAAGGAAFAVAHVVMPDNSGAQSSVEKLVTDAVTAVATKKLAAAIPLLVQDAMGVVATLTPPAVTTTTTTVANPPAA